MIRIPNKHSAKAPSPSGANTLHRPKSGANHPATSKDGVQGEGNYEAAREFNEAERKFVASGKVAAAARAAAPKSEPERQAMFRRCTVGASFCRRRWRRAIRASDIPGIDVVRQPALLIFLADGQGAGEGTRE